MLQANMDITLIKQVTRLRKAQSNLSRSFMVIIEAFRINRFLIRCDLLKIRGTEY